MRKFLIGLALLMAVAVATPRAADAYVSVSIGLPGFGFYVAPPAYYAPPVVYAPPAYYAPPVYYRSYYPRPVYYGRPYYGGGYRYGRGGYRGW